MITLMPILMWVAALVGVSATVYVSSQPMTLSDIGRASLRWLFIFPLGVQGIWDFVTYGFLPQAMADQFGWAPSPFQMEVAFANLGLGAASFYAAFAKRPARMAVAIAAACYLVGSGLSLVNNILDGDDLTAGIAGAILLQNFLTPVVTLVLLFVGPQEDRAEAASKTSGSAKAPRGLQPQPAPGAPPPRPALPAPRPQEPAYGKAAPAYGQPKSSYALDDVVWPQDVAYGPSDPFGEKIASGLQERAPWEPASDPASSNASYGNPSAPRQPTGNRPPPQRPRANPAPQNPAPRPTPPPQRAQPMPQSPSQPRYDDFDPGFDQSLEDELERARRQLMDDLQKGRKPGS